MNKKQLIILFLISSLLNGYSQNRWVHSGQSNQGSYSSAIRNILDSMGNEDTLWGSHLGGTPITGWIEGPIGGPYVKGPLYKSFLFAGDGSSAVEKSAALTGISLSEIKGLFWWQGEAGHAVYTDYALRFETMMIWLNQDYGTANLKAVLVEPWALDTNYTTTIVAHVKAIAANKPEERASISSRGYRRVDNVHIGTAGAHAIAGESILKMWQLTGLDLPQEGAGSILDFGNQ